MKRKRVRELIRKYLKGTSTRDESRLLDDHYNRYLQHSRFEATEEDIARARETNHAAIRDYLHGEQRSGKRRLALRTWTSIAAMVVLATTVTLIYQRKDATPDTETVNDVPPGGNKALLTLVDGRQIDLSSAQNGIIVGDNGISYPDGTEVFSQEVGKTGSQEDSPHLMSLTTPNGGQYRITLPDGTTVWLNAASTLRYPSRFTGNTREVFLEGEGFFEVSSGGSTPFALRSLQTTKGKQQTAPFIVKTNGQETTVLGTEFNVNAYADEPATKTTVVSGAVRVSLTHNNPDQSLITSHQSLVLNPGQQSILSAAYFRTAAIQADSEIAWKEGKFYFNDTPFDAMMRELARWYDVKLSYTSESVPDIRFTGELSRNVTLRTLLSFIEQLDVTIRLQGKTLIIG